MHDYKELKVWQKSHELTLNIYKITKKFPSDEKFGLISQLRRASSSIPTNIAEGYGQLTKVNYLRFVGMARGSAFEIEYQLKLSRDLGYISNEEYDMLNNLNTNILKMLNGLINSLRNDNK